MRTGCQPLSVFRDATWIPIALVVAAGVTLGAAFDRTHEIAALDETETHDSDGDGLVDIQELILQTSADEEDTDQDGFSDLEEIARNSDPTDDISLPSRFPFSVGLTGRSVDGTFTAVSPVFAEQGTFPRLDFEFGVVLPGGARIPINPSYYLPAARAEVLPAMEQQDRVVLIEINFPSSLITAFGSLHVYSTVSDPELPDFLASAAVLNLVDFNGVVVAAEEAPPSVHQGEAGIIYYPLSEPEQIPSAWNSGELCWQQAAAVGVVGSVTAFEIGSAQCIASDTYCATATCGATVGGSVELVDPGALVGG